MNANNTFFLARDRTSGLLREADRERLARQATNTGQGSSNSDRMGRSRWILNLLREPAGSR